MVFICLERPLTYVGVTLKGRASERAGPIMGRLAREPVRKWSDSPQRRSEN